MTPERDPPRLSDESSEVGRFLRKAAGQAREDLPTPEALDRIFSQLPSGGSHSGGASQEPGHHKPTKEHSTPLSTHSGVGGSVGIGGLAGLLVCGILWWTTPAWLDAPKPAQVAPATMASGTLSAAPTTSNEPMGLADHNKPTQPDKQPRPQASDSPKPAPTSEPTSPAPLETSTASATEVPTQEPAETEAALLDRAQRQIQSNGNGALALCEEHRSKFPKGVLGQEREVIAISALVALGRLPEARARAKMMIAGNPNSAYVRRLSVIVPGLESADNSNAR